MQIIVLITLLFRRVVKNGSDKYLKGIVIVIFITTVTDFLAAFLANAEMFGVKVSDSTYILSIVLNYLYFFLRSLHAPIYLIYVIKTSDTWHTLMSNKPVVLIGIAPFVVATIALFSNLFTNNIFTINPETLQYSRGSRISILYACNGIYMAMGVSMLVSYRRLFQKEKFFALVAMYPFTVTAILIQILFPGMPP